MKNSFRKYNKGISFTYDLDIQRRQIIRALILLWLAKDVYFIDMQGKKKRITSLTLIFYYFPKLLVEIILISLLFLSVKQMIKELKSHKKTKIFKSLSKKIAYFRTDHSFAVKSGGSVGHIAGVANGFVELNYDLFFISTDRLELIDEAKTHFYLIKPVSLFQDIHELPELDFNRSLIKEARKIFEKEEPGFVYQRYSHNNFSGAYISSEHNLPFILEYNGSEVWMAKNWSRPFRFGSIAFEIEELNLKLADLIVVVSNAMKKELIERGVFSDKILVNPNCVDLNRYNPDIDGNSIREKYNLKNKIIVGFIGTFGKWHGAEILAEAVVRIIKDYAKKDKIHFLFIGDGLTMPQVKKIIYEGIAQDYVTFTGLVPQTEGPFYLAGCDILVSPHVPNPDGTPFFGSPTKLFEYMAMGRGIAASNLEQIGEVLENEKTALLVGPGDVDQLMNVILRLVEDEELRERLGQNAYREVKDKYTWKKNVEKIVSKLKEMGLVDN
ncbi:MAG: glycosyltransferase [Actinobacteria bacterium]|nr:glycosyltransferase [Actinomycetota bacterium]